MEDRWKRLIGDLLEGETVSRSEAARRLSEFSGDNVSATTLGEWEGKPGLWLGPGEGGRIPNSVGERYDLNRIQRALKVVLKRQAGVPLQRMVKLLAEEEEGVVMASELWGRLVARQFVTKEAIDLDDPRAIQLFSEMMKEDDAKAFSRGFRDELGKLGPAGAKVLSELARPGIAPVLCAEGVQFPQCAKPANETPTQRAERERYERTFALADQALGRGGPVRMLDPSLPHEDETARQAIARAFTEHRAEAALGGRPALSLQQFEANWKVLHPRVFELAEREARAPEEEKKRNRAAGERLLAERIKAERAANPKLTDAEAVQAAHRRDRGLHEKLTRARRGEPM